MIKMLELLSESSPKDQVMTAKKTQVITAYASGWLEFEARINEEDHFEKSKRLKRRAANLYRRAKRYGIAGLEQKYPGFSTALSKNKDGALRFLQQEDVPLLTWTGLSWISWLKHSADDPHAIGELYKPVQMLLAAERLNPDFESGLLHEFFIHYYSSDIGGKKMDRVNIQYQKLIRLTKRKILEVI